MNTPLQNLIGLQIAQPVPPAVAALGTALRQRYGAHVLAMLFYGSCRRVHDDAGGIADIYLLVDAPRATGESMLTVFANRILPPNVYYLEIPFDGRTARAKYAVLTLAQFERGTAHWFHSYLWGRFAQPCGLLHAADAAAKQRVTQAIVRAVTTFTRHALPRLPAQFDAETLWTRGLLLSYAAELRSETPDKIRALYAQSATDFDALTRAVAAECGWEGLPAGQYRNPATRGKRILSIAAWAVRCVYGKLLSVLRLLKASFTFDGGIAYVAWKIERHSGVRLEITPFMQRNPRLGGLGAFWRTWRRGGFR